MQQGVKFRGGQTKHRQTSCTTAPISQHAHWLSVDITETPARCSRTEALKARQLCTHPGVVGAGSRGSCGQQAAVQAHAVHEAREHARRLRSQLARGAYDEGLDPWLAVPRRAPGARDQRQQEREGFSRPCGPNTSLAACALGPSNAGNPRHANAEGCRLIPLWLQMRGCGVPFPFLKSWEGCVIVARQRMPETSSLNCKHQPEVCALSLVGRHFLLPSITATARVVRLQTGNS